jgi:hypothetical protein
MRGDLSFRPVGVDEETALAEWLAGETWPFHARARLTVEDALESIRAGDFAGANRPTGSSSPMRVGSESSITDTSKT